MGASEIPFFADHTLQAEIEKTGILLTFRAGEVVVPPEKYIKVIPLLRSGTLKILRLDGHGNELFLYHLEAGESCAVSLSTCLTDKISNIKAVAETDTELIAVSASNAIKWFNQYPSWRNFVLQTMDARFNDLLQTVDNIAFHHMDERLIDFLLKKSTILSSNTLHLTHQDIATELSTSREVISRLLKHLEQKGRVRLSRNKIEILSLV